MKVKAPMSTLKLEAVERMVGNRGRVRSREAFRLFPPAVEVQNFGFAFFLLRS